MKQLTHLVFRIRWINLPATLLIVLLQRTPVLRTLVADGVSQAMAPVGCVLRSVFGLGALGALHSLAGATAWIVRQGTTEIINLDPVTGVGIQNPATGTVGVPLTSVAFTYTGTPSQPQYFRVSGQLPPGLSYSPAAVNGTVPTFTGAAGILGTPQQAGTFTAMIQGFGVSGNGEPQPVVFIIAPAASSLPTFTQQPSSQSVNVGGNAAFTVTATGNPSYQWRRNGIDLPEAKSPTLQLTNVQLTDAGDYSVVISNSAGNAVSNVATLTVISNNRTARLSNLSVRTSMASGQTLIVGVVVNDGSRDILVRAAGPALAALGLTTAMADPQLELYSGSTMVLANNDWMATLAPMFQSVGAFPFDPGSKDAAFVRGLNAGYSIQARGTGPGVVLVEAYDTGPVTAARLVNVSARNRVGTGDDILIAGFYVSGTGAKSLLIRAVGPKLGAFGVTGFLENPKLEIYNGAGVKVTENDDWAPGLAANFAAVGAFALDAGSRDAALIASLPAGSYTAQVRGSDGGTGEALIEIYEIP